MTLERKNTLTRLAQFELIHNSSAILWLFLRAELRGSLFLHHQIEQFELVDFGSAFSVRMVPPVAPASFAREYAFEAVEVLAISRSLCIWDIFFLANDS